MAETETKETTDETKTDDAGSQQTPEELQEELKRLSAKVELERKHRKKAETERSEYEKKMQEYEEAQAAREEEIARKQAEGGDTKALEESWKAKFTKYQQTKEKQYQDEIAQTRSMVERLTVKNDAQKLANQLFGDKAEVMLPHVEKRLKVGFGDDGPFSQVLDESGQLSADNLDDLANEFKTSPKFAPFVVATKATGSGASGGKKNGGGAPEQKTIPRSEFYNKPEPERKALIKEGYKLTD